MNSNQQQLPCDNVNNCQPPPLMPRHMASHPAMRPPMSASNHPRAYVPGVNVLRAAGPHQGTSHQGAPHHGGPQHSNSFHNGPHHGSPLADAIHPAQHGIQATINRNADNSMYMTGGRHAHGSASPSTDPVLPSFPGMNTGMANSAPQGNMLSAFTNLNYNTGWNAYDSSQELLPQEEIAKLAECVDSLSRLNSMGHMTDPFGGLPSMERNDQINEGHKLYMAAMRQLSEEYPDTSNPPVSTPDSLSTDYTNTNSNAMSQGYTTPQYSENSSYSPFGSPMFSSDALNSVTNELYRASGSVNTVISSSSDADHSSYTAPASTITTSTCQSKATLCSNITPEEKSQKPSYVDIAKKNAATSSGSCKPAAVSKSKSEGTTTKAPLTEKGLAQETAKKATDGKRMKSLSSKSSDNSFGVDSSDDGSKSGFSIPKQTSKAASSKQTNKHKSDTKSPEKEEKLFFDPKRIFAPRPVKSQSTSNTEKKTEPLNNGKPKQNQTKCGIEKSNTSSFINNDLSYDWKQTNCDRHMADSTYKSEQTTKSNVTDPKLHRRTGDKKSMASKKFDRQKGGSDLYRKIRKTKDDNMKVVMGVYFHKFWTYIKDIIVWLLTVICDVTIMLLKLTYLLCLIFLQFCIVYAVRGYRYVSAKIFKSEEEEGNEWSRLFSRTTKKESECNIPLPSTGDEAMKRLLSCKDKDPYSILGVKSDAPDDIIKKYYRRQAVLVHPDKNKQPGAEEAFKILGHAFDLIGEPEKRETYDAEISKTRGMEEFADLLTKLHEKTQEAANQMGCNICEGKHRRVLTERRPWCDARFCEKCQIFHSAKEGDVWAETRMCGFIWHYYACMDSKVFDITEWAKCQHARFKRMQPNSHQVIYRLASNGKKHNQRNEPDIDEFLNQIFRQAGVDGYDGTPQPENERAPRPNASNKKKNRKKKR